MNYKITNGAVSFGANTILEEIDFEIKDKDKIAIVGRNGAGKSTLLNSIIDNNMLEEGVGEEKFNIYKQGNPNIGYLKQINFENSTLTMLEEILQVYDNIIKLEEKIANLAEKLQTTSDENTIKEYTNALEKFEILGGYTYKKEYETAIKKFGFLEEDKYKKISEFSGGQRTKIAFLKLLLSKPDILLLDEPTNHLDITAIEWLEKYLRNYPNAVVIVSHDRMFLDRIVNKVYEIEYGKLTEYTGNYADFENQKKANYEKQLKDYEYQQAEIKRLKAIADRFRYKPTKAKMALSKLKKIEQMVIIEEPNKYDMKTFHANFNIQVESGKMVLSVKNLKIGYDKPIQTISFELYKGQKLGIIGENGIGKSTLLKTLNGNIPKLGGEFEYGYHVDMGYFDQQMEFEDTENTVFDDMYNTFPNLTTTQIRTMLGNFLFSGEDVFKQIKVLSGGEKGRLQLCKILKKGPNLLLLDEPTNHMDILGKESLEEILKAYKGTLIFVSHDRYFVNKIADSLLIFEKGKATYFDGNYEEYLRKKEENEDEDAIQDKKVDNTVKEKTNNSYFTNKEINKAQNKITKIEKEIEEKEEKIKNIQAEMLKEENSTNYIKLKELEENIQKINSEIELKMQEWEELNSKLAELKNKL
jgi:ATP-binding cassette subfamily F protein 3